MRLFVAVDPDEDVRRALSDVVDECRDRLDAVPGLRVRWVRTGQLHLTLRFLGDVDEALVGGLERALQAQVPGPSFDCGLDAFGVFPASGRPAVLWIGLAGVAPLQALQARVDAAVTTAGLPGESRPYAPHLTVGRIVESRGVARSSLLARCPAVPHLRWQVDGVTLVHSRLSAAGARHEARLRIPLIR